MTLYRKVSKFLGDRGRLLELFVEHLERLLAVLHLARLECQGRRIRVVDEWVKLLRRYRPRLMAVPGGGGRRAAFAATAQRRVPHGCGGRARVKTGLPATLGARSERWGGGRGRGRGRSRRGGRRGLGGRVHIYK